MSSIINRVKYFYITNEIYAALWFYRVFTIGLFIDIYIYIYKIINVFKTLIILS